MKSFFKLVTDIIFIILTTGFILYILLLVHSFGHWELPYVPTMRHEKKVLKKHLKIKNGSNVLDMGSGLGSMLVFFSQYPVSVKGIEMRKFLAFLSRIRVWFHFWKKGKVEVIQGDFFKEDLKKYDIIYCFHITRLIDRLYPKIEKELGNDAMLISYKFSFPLSEKKFSLEKIEESKGSYFYIYKRKKK